MVLKTCRLLSQLQGRAIDETNAQNKEAEKSPPKAKNIGKKEEAHHVHMCPRSCSKEMMRRMKTKAHRLPPEQPCEHTRSAFVSNSVL
ncbi:hypothetical protein ABZP36_004724 [Zizania latifolia]